MSFRKLTSSGNFKRKVAKQFQSIKNQKLDQNLDKNLGCIINAHHSGLNTHQIPNSSSSSSNTCNQDNENILNVIVSDESDLEDDTISKLEQHTSDLKKDLQHWSINHQITHVALKDLLEILNKNSEFKLPKDPRTLLNTPYKKNDNIKEISGGQYWHNGLRACITEIYNNTNTKIQNISININIDGLPIFNSSKFEFWPILFNINEINVNPMIIGIYYGKGKPGNLNEFLSEFVEELKMILEDGVLIESFKINVSLKCFVCDSPARSFVKGVVNFNSQHGCQKCTITGEYSYISHTNYYPNKEFPRRTNEDFRNKTDELHHKMNSVILNLPIDLIDCFPVADSLHLVDLGIMKRLLIGWRDGTFKTKRNKWSAKQTQEISTKMVKIKLPKELHRAIRGLDVLSFWKGLEYRNFLLYYGIVVLKDELQTDVYHHLLCLFCAITICSTDYYKCHLHVAEQLLKHFVDSYCKIYGEHYVTSNVHNLTHLVEDVKKLGNLTKFSAYPFESKLYEIKRMIRSGNNPLAQIANRLIEKQKSEIYLHEETEKQTYPIMKYMTTNLKLSSVLNDDSLTIYKIIIFKDYVLGGNCENSCFLTKTNQIVRFVAVANDKNNIIISGKKILELCPYFHTPINSMILNIYNTVPSTVIGIANDHSIPEELFTVSMIKCKLVCVMTEKNCTFIPLLHTLCE